MFVIKCTWNVLVRCNHTQKVLQWRMRGRVCLHTDLVRQTRNYGTKLTACTLPISLQRRQTWQNNRSTEQLNPFTPNDPYRGLTAPLTSKRFILYIYSTNITTDNFKHGIYSPFYSLQNAVCFIILTYLVPVLFTFYIQDVLKLKK
jgi:hypothetical protein